MRKPSLVPTADKIGVSRDEAAALISVCPTTFDQLVSSGKMPKAKRLNRRKVWQRAAIERAFAALADDGQDGVSDEWDIAA